MRKEASILFLGEHGGALSELADRSRALGFRTLRAKLPQDAVELAREREEIIGSVVVDPELPVMDLGAALRPIVRQAGLSSKSLIAAGAQPSLEWSEELLGAGIERALWSPVDDTALRFELNRAMSAKLTNRPRTQERAPMGWEIRVYQGGRRKLGRVYSLSSGGLFLETTRPAMRGAEIAVDLPIGGPYTAANPLALAGRVVYTNVPGNVARKTLPHGMAVAFGSVDEQASEALCRCIDARNAQFQIVGS